MTLPTKYWKHLSGQDNDATKNEKIMFNVATAVGGYIIGINHAKRAVAKQSTEIAERVFRGVGPVALLVK